MSSVKSRLEKLERATPQQSEEDRRWSQEFNRLLLTMSRAHAEIVLSDLHDDQGSWSNLTLQAACMVEVRLRGGIEAYALPPVVAQVYLDVPNACPGEWDCSDCGYKVPHVRSPRPYSKVYSHGPQYGPTIMRSPDSVYFAACPLCGGRVDDFAWLAGRCYQDRINDAAACGRGCDRHDHFTFCLSSKSN